MVSRRAVVLLVSGVLVFPPISGGQTTPAGVPARAEAPPPSTDLYGDPLPPGALARLGTVRFRHGGWPNALQFSPDGRTLIASGNSDTAYFCDTATGRERPRPAGARGCVTALALSGDGRVLAAAGDEDGCAIGVWDATADKLLHRLRGHAEEVRSLRLSADGTALASEDFDKTLYLWDAARGRELARWAGEGFPRAPALSPGGEVLAFADEDGGVRLWDVGRGKELRRLAGHGKFVHYLAFLAGGTRLASHAEDMTLRVWDVASGKELRRVPVRAGSQWSGFGEIALSPDGARLAANGEGGALRVWDAATGKELWQLPGDVRGPITFSPDGKTLATGGPSGSLRTWDVEAGKELTPDGGHRGFVEALAFSPDGRTLVTGGQDWTARLWDARTGQEVQRLREGAGVSSVAFSPDGRALAAGQGDGVSLWDPVAGRRTHRFARTVFGRTPLAFSPGGRLLAEGHNQRVRLWDAVTGQEVRSLGAKCGQVQALAFSPDGRTLASAGDGGPLQLWEVPSGRELGRLGDGGAKVCDLSFSPDGASLAAGLYGGVVRFWEASTGRGRPQLAGYYDPDADEDYVFLTLAFSPDGRTLATGSNTHSEVRLWEVATGRVRQELAGHRGDINKVIFSPDGRTLASAGGDNTALVWDLTFVDRGIPSRTPPPEGEALWNDLAAGDARKAYRAARLLASAPAEAVRLLRTRLRPVVAPDRGRLGRLLGDLNDDRFDVRERATRELEYLGKVAEAGLREALARGPAPEARTRIERLLARFEAETWSGEELRALRAVEVLERVGGPDARRVLEALAGGAPESRLTREAKASLGRLAKHSPAEPRLPRH